MAEKLFYSMGEVAELFDVNQSLLRHWESQFPILRPKRNKKGNRLFSPRDVETLKLIYHLVKERGMTLEGAKKALGRRKLADGDGVDRDAELMERLQRIRAMLVEVREELKEPAGAVARTVGTAAVADAAGADEAEAAASPEVAETVAAVASVPAGSAVPQPTAGTLPETLATSGAAAAAVAGGVSASSARRGRKAVVKIVEGAGAAGAETDAGQPVAPKPAARRGRRRKDDDADKELFAFYEQSLF